MPGFSLVNVGALSKPADTLVTKISNAIGRHFDPRQEIRMAEAQARADRIRRVGAEETDIEIAILRDRAAYRFANEEMTKQLNMESITEKALPRLDDKANPDAMENDWIMNFFDKCRMVSDEDMQQIWAGILAGEANNPGSFSRRTVNLVADLDKRDAELFRNLCGFAWMIGSLRPLVFDTHHEIYNGRGINFGSLSQLETLGLIHFNDISGFKILHLPKRFNISYYGKLAALELPADDGNELQEGKVLLTRAGLELAPICGSTPVEGFFEYVYDRWAEVSLVPPRDPDPAKPESVTNDTEAKIEGLLEYRELASQMRRQVVLLTEQYPDQWAAMVPGGELFIAGTMDELLAVLDEKNLRDGNVVIEFLDSNPTPLVL
ncbi:MAG: DUF2806 domain-containing protein [Dehalococcoidia bacterium]|nr:DUF2806 domain-containing protein [Dehalococcoidia bacterium]